MKNNMIVKANEISFKIRITIMVISFKADQSNLSKVDPEFPADRLAGDATKSTFSF